MKRFTVIIVFLLAGAIGIAPAIGQNTDWADQEARYAALVDDVIETHLSKGQYIHSRWPHVRQNAAKALEKAAFCGSHRDELIQALISAQVEPKSYKVQLFINQQYRQNREQAFTAEK